MDATKQTEINSEYAVHILKTMAENVDLREIELVAGLDEQK